MIREISYSERRSAKWLATFLLALSCFAFSLNPVPVDAKQSLLSQIEQVVSSKDKSEGSISFQNIFITSRFIYLNSRSRNYERSILLIHQNQNMVYFASISDKIRSFLKHKHLLYPRISPQNKDEDFSPFLLV